MAKLIKVAAFADGRPCPIAGKYLMGFDFEAHGGAGFGSFTSDPARALRFDDAGAAFKFWSTTSSKYPVRFDGRPNKPLTCTTVEICDEPQ